MSWFPRFIDRGENSATTFASPPSGGRSKLLLLGVVLPIVGIAYGVHCWTTKEGLWLGRQADMVVTGTAAEALAVVWIACGALAHFRWFWGLLPNERVFSIGTVLSVLTILGAGAVAIYQVLRYGP